MAEILLREMVLVFRINPLCQIGIMFYQMPMHIPFLGTISLLKVVGAIRITDDRTSISAFRTVGQLSRFHCKT
jgi:hypothetical protein